VTRQDRATETFESMITELKTLLIDELNLEDMSPGDIDDNAPLFGEGLGLDSIDALELAVIMEKKYGIKIESGDDKNQQIFSTPLALAEFIETNRK
jgi:acyl carrier protein